MHGPRVRRDKQIKPAHDIVQFAPSGTAHEVADLSPEFGGQQGGKLPGRAPLCARTEQMDGAASDASQRRDD
jgi:hypothetical protein